VQVWDIARRQVILRIPDVSGDRCAIAYHPCGDLLAVAHQARGQPDDSVMLWDVSLGKPLTKRQSRRAVRLFRGNNSRQPG
jgi:hypothetical protein